jgi:hypothetical protein
MPFDPTFTPEEALAAIEKDPTVLDRIVSGVLPKRDYIVRSKTDDAMYTQNITTKAISDATKSHADKLEADVKEIAGVDKASADEKYYEYNKRVLRSLKDKEKELSDELTQLKSKSTLSEAEKTQLEEAKAAIKANNTKIAEMESNHKTQLTEAKAEGKILMAVAGARSKYLKTIPEDVIKTTEGVFTGQLLKEARFTDDGKIYFVGPDGKTPLLNQTTQEFVTADERYAEIAKSLIDPGQTQKGAGGNGGPASGNSGDKLPAGVETQVQATEWLQKQGLVQGSKEFTAKWNELGIDKLPLRK